jgi:FAD/FMN-containing dehydrogenase/Fe-S oxidoreductase
MQRLSDPTVPQLLAESGVEIDGTTLTRSQYAHDASNYRITPLAVAFPRNVDDVVEIVATCAAHGVPITARGAGTGMAGNSVGSGIVIDFRRHMHRVHNVDASTRTVVVEPGVVLDDLQSAVSAHHLMFGPDPSSHSRATIGGMLGNDACGNHSVAYGRTSDHVIELELVLADGTRAIATRNGLRAIDTARAPVVEALASRLRAIADAGEASLRSEFERCPRQVSGYAAHRLLPEHGFDVARLLVGSEGSLAIVVSATLALVDLPRSTQLLVLGYRDLIGAARDVPALLLHRPAAIEALDKAMVQTMRARRGEGSVPHLPEGDAWLFVEFADTVAIADTAALADEILNNGNAVSSLSIADPLQRSAFWRLREDGAGLASNLLDGAQGRPGWEDAAVPPHRLAEYLDGLDALQQRHGFHGVLYGHFGAGCVHIRFDFDTATDDGRSAMRAFVRDAAVLVAQCGGSVSGEHGDGRARGELLPLMYSQPAREAFRQIKRAFDRSGILNPGIIVDAPALSENMPSRSPSGPTAFAMHADGGDLSTAASRCVGIGRCVATNVTAMCPTYNVTQDERDSTRGRARTIQDLFNGSGVTTEEALETLDNCLSCKACATECPTGVDMATYKAELLHQHFRHRLRPLTHYTLGWLPRLLGVLTPLAPAINAVLAKPLIRRALPALAGITSERQLPRFSSAEEVRSLRAIRSDEPRALLFIDSLTRAFRPEAAAAAARVLDAAGIPVQSIADGCCGVAFISTGQLDAARREQRRLLDIIDGYSPDLPIIVLEPSCAASLSHDLPELVADPRAARAAARIRTFAAALTELAPDWQWPSLPPTLVLQTHCHERATFTDSVQSEILRKHGADVAEAVGCCGMAGNFGFEKQHYDLSIKVAERSLLPAIDAADGEAVILADGFGCACQVEHLRPRATPLHLAQLLDRLL